MYNKLVTVNFEAGYGGDFFSSVLYSNLNNVNLPLPDSNNKYNFQNDYDNRIEKFFILRNFYYFTMLYYNNTLLNNYKQRYQTLDQSQYKQMDHVFSYVVDLYDRLYDDNDQVFFQNVIDFSRQLVDDQTPNVLSVHYTKYRIEQLSFQDIFPGSVNLLLNISNSKSHSLFNFIGWYKNSSVDDNYSVKWPEWYKQTFDFKEDVISVDRLFIFNDDDYIDEVLSMINTKLDITLDKQTIIDYRTRNQQILTEYFNLSDPDLLESDSFLDSVVLFMQEKFNNRNDLLTA